MSRFVMHILRLHLIYRTLCYIPDTRQDRTAILGGIPSKMVLLYIYISGITAEFGRKNSSIVHHLMFFCPHIYGFHLFFTYVPLFFCLFST